MNNKQQYQEIITKVEKKKLELSECENKLSELQAQQLQINQEYNDARIEIELGNMREDEFKKFESEFDKLKREIKSLTESSDRKKLAIKKLENDSLPILRAYRKDEIIQLHILMEEMLDEGDGFLSDVEKLLDSVINKVAILGNKAEQLRNLSYQMYDDGLPDFEEVLSSFQNLPSFDKNKKYHFEGIYRYLNMVRNAFNQSKSRVSG